MNKNFILNIFFLVLFNISGVFGQPVISVRQDQVRNDQILYNGKEWRNLYSAVRGDQFLYSGLFLPGSLTINGMTFSDVILNYDIYNDELLIPSTHGTVLQLNKEMVDSFTLVFQFKSYRFRNTIADSLTGIKGYVNVLYSGKSSLYVKYRKEIQLLAVDDKYDLFYQTQKMYLVNKGVVNQITGKSDFLKILQSEKTRIRDFMKKNNLRVSKKLPESFIPVIRYYDSISQ